jgi:hypothetical protein
MVALCIFSDDGKIYLMGKDAASVVACVKAGTQKKPKELKYIKDHETRLKYIERAIIAMEEP